MQSTEQVVHRRSVQQLRSFCRGEISARDSYVVALTYPLLSEHKSTLVECMESHQRRAELLAQEIERLGGKVPESAGPWGALTDIIERSAITFGRSMAVKALREGEDHGIRDYQADIPKLDPEVREFVESEILPWQVATHGAMVQLEKSMS